LTVEHPLSSLERSLLQDAGALAVQGADPVDLRPLSTTSEFRSCIELQRQTWGPGYMEVVPSSMLQVVDRMGGVVAGAFSVRDRLLGFVFGLTGLLQGRLVHWSHMLAVLPEHRNLGIGRQLKEYQRQRLAHAGVAEIRWTFDPLVSRNGHLNVTRLGAEICDFIPDMYGVTGSELHRFGTDRFLTRWPVAGVERLPALRVVDPSEVAEVPILNVEPAAWQAECGGWLNGSVTTGLPERLRVAIPADIEELGESSVHCARQWRESTRAAFQFALAHGYTVESFERGDGGRSCYTMVRRAPA
jgi:predicted GNAT superfamily acetyltransferase